MGKWGKTINKQKCINNVYTKILIKIETWKYTNKSYFQILILLIVQK